MIELVAVAGSSQYAGAAVFFLVGAVGIPLAMVAVVAVIDWWMEE